MVNYRMAEGGSSLQAPADEYIHQPSTWDNDSEDPGQSNILTWCDPCHRRNHYESMPI